ncbi:MAG: hypothetical protein RLZZ196_709 [Bacteroidota bacterium]|jgi:hypothetical protein
MDTDKNLSYTLEVQEDPETGELILQFPEEMLKTLEWKEGDTLEWKENEDGSWLLSKLR